MPETPDISVLLPVRNGATHLPEALASVFGQEGMSFEVVVVDDGSTDETPEILARAAACERRLRRFRIAASGLVPALNAGLRVCRGRVVVRQDHDDQSLPGRFRRLLALLDGKGLDAADMGMRLLESPVTGSGMRRWAAWHKARELDHRSIARDRYVDCPLVGMAFRRTSVLELGGFRDAGWNEDHDLFLRLYHAGARFGSRPEPGYVMRDRPDRISRTAAHSGLERLRALKASFLADYELSETGLSGRRVAVWGTGRNGKRMALALQHAGVPVHWFADYAPRKLGRVIHGARVLAPSELPPPGQVVVLIAVGREGAREEIRETLGQMGHREEVDFLAVC